MPTEVIFGLNAVEDRLSLSAAKPQRLMVQAGKSSERVQRVIQKAESSGCGVEVLSDSEFATLTKINHQGVALEVEAIRWREDDLYEIVTQHQGHALILVLDGVTDARNLGACLRSAAGLGVHAVVTPKDKSASLNEGAVKTASGAAAYIPFIQVTNLARSLGKLQKQGVWVMGTLLETEQNISDINLVGDIALVMGSEEKGLRHNTIKHCDYLAKIPMQNERFGFNVSVATGICLYEINRQRLAVGGAIK